MTWTSFHQRGEILRDVIASADRRRDGRLPVHLPGVAEAFGDDLTLLGALQLRWYTRLSGRIDRELMCQLDLEDAVIAAWHATADELPGVLAILDRQRALPASPAMAEAMARSDAKQHVLLAMMAGRASAPDGYAARAGAAIEQRARASYRPRIVDTPRPHGLLRRLRAGVPA